MPPATAWLIGALLAQGALAMVLLLALGAIRVPLVTSGAVRMRDIALSREAWPERGQQVSNAFDNQFQLPVLFYLAGGLSLYFGTLWFEALIAWLFVASRVVHAVIHSTSNNVPQRFAAYAIGLFLLGAFWIDLVARLLMEGVST